MPTRWVGGERGRFKKLREGGNLVGYLSPWGESCLYCMRVGQVPRYSQVLLLPLGIPPMPALACFTQTLPQESEVWRVLTTTRGKGYGAISAGAP